MLDTISADATRQRRRNPHHHAAGDAPGETDGARGMAASGQGVAMRTAHERRAMRTREETDRKILQATLDIITSQGIGAVTIEEVSRRSGVAKTTIYRRYRNTDDMLRKVHALDVNDSTELSELSPTRENLGRLLDFLVHQFSSQIGIKAVGVLLSSDNEYFGRIIQQAIAPERNRFSAFFERGMRAGAFKDGLDSVLLFNTIIGSLVACAALPPSTTEQHWAERMSGLIWNVIATV